ncbi:MAG: MerR family transcriptional regulator [Clostridia bacterium]|nr:MerR family transcriptional regulator [Clostridia bacterium]
MEIKEVEKLLGVSRSNIRFYEKEGLLTPERSKNNYRRYSAENVAALRKIIVLRKMGFTVEEIARMQSGALSLPQAASDNVLRLEEEIQRLQGALDATRELARAQTEFEQLDENACWDKIIAAEQNGQDFADICKDCLRFSAEEFDLMWESVFFLDFKAMRNKFGGPLAWGLLLLICVVRGIARWQIHGESFWQGFFYPLELFVIGMAIFLPIYLLGKKHPKIASVLLNIVVSIAVAFLAVIALLILYCLGTLLLNWIF